jgi:hypothetical protein
MKNKIQVRSEYCRLSRFQVISNITMALLPALALISAAFMAGHMPDWSAVGYLAGGSIISSLMNTVRQLFTDNSGEIQIKK